ncbi:MAG: class I tRNA ligase family protein, partial [Acidimicrobiales bacterium]
MSRFYVTTPIYYVNDAPHIGTAYTTLTADALARWHRLFGEDVFFLTGTDEHGVKVERAAAANGRTPIEQADITSARFKEAWAALDISYDAFIRTTEPDHYASVSALFTKIYENGFIEVGAYEGWYCVSCETFFAADEAEEVEGERRCPNEPLHAPLKLIQETNYFFALSR